jgi:stearoyl-CoA desaturase (delta-9 desaturase)
MSYLKRLDLANASFLAATHVLSAVAAVLYATMLPWNWATAAMSVVLLFCTSISITGGYHRLFAHRAYAANAALRLFYLVFGAAAFQNSAITWSADHRRHHGATDTDGDPYTVKHGFWWAHILWVIEKRDSEDTSNVPDLWKDPLIAFQHRHVNKLGTAFGFLLPTALAACWGDPIGGFLLGGWVRLLLQYHATFAVNSVAHTIGGQPYSDADTARDSFVTALITLGEGYHNYHHTFPNDYRNGVRAWQFDPTKWIVHALSWIGVTWNLRRVPDEQVLRQRIRMDMRRMLTRMHDAAERSSVWHGRIDAAREQLEALLVQWAEVKKEYAARKAQLGREAREELSRLKAEVAARKAEFRTAYRVWTEMCRRPELAFQRT